MRPQQDTCYRIFKRALPSLQFVRKGALGLGIQSSHRSPPIEGASPFRTKRPFTCPNFSAFTRHWIFILVLISRPTSPRSRKPPSNGTVCACACTTHSPRRRDSPEGDCDRAARHLAREYMSASSRAFCTGHGHVQCADENVHAQQRSVPSGRCPGHMRAPERSEGPHLRDAHRCYVVR